ncbi:Arc family DNA-binding protein [Flavonifractor plautii]|nr:Arc family DNA-binding protein [Flavonifractor plautii]
MGGGTLAERKAKWQNDYIARTYDRVNLTMPKGRKEVIQAKADAQGESVNAYINKAIEQRMEREAGE